MLFRSPPHPIPLLPSGYYVYQVKSRPPCLLSDSPFAPSVDHSVSCHSERQGRLDLSASRHTEKKKEKKNCLPHTPTKELLTRYKPWGWKETVGGISVSLSRFRFVNLPEVSHHLLRKAVESGDTLSRGLFGLSERRTSCLRTVFTVTILGVNPLFSCCAQ